MNIGNINVRSPLIKRWNMRRPHGGWNITWKIGNRSLYATGISPAEVIAKIEAWEKQNNVEPDLDQIWIEANIQWLQNISKSFHSSPGILDQLRNAKKGIIQAKPPENRTFQIYEWAPRWWNMMWLVVNADKFSLQTFHSSVFWIKDMINPEQNPRFGCVNCYQHFMEFMDANPINTVTDKQKAWNWLHRLHNHANINKSANPWTKEQVNRQHFG